jgi:hypothetical protein
MILRLKGKHYNGRDNTTGVDIRAKEGDLVEVSDEKAGQLLADFPKLWEKAEEGEEVSAAQITPPDEAGSAEPVETAPEEEAPTEHAHHKPHKKKHGR